MRRYILKRREKKVYLKCKVAGCLMAYVTFNSVWAINAHHRLYHRQVTYNCNMCHKTVPTLNALRLHRYCHHAKMHKCKDCEQSFIHLSKLRQHRRCHIKQRMYVCLHGGCNRKYKHPQDLTHHQETHQQERYECPMCNKAFREK